MSSFNFRTLLPHLAAVFLFVLVAVLYCKPALEGQVLQQSDVVHFKGMSKDIHDYREKHGVAPLWTTRMFGGMPGYQIATNNNNYLSYWANEVFSLFIPRPFRFFILACLGFYFLAISLRTNPWLAMLGALGYAYASYNAIIVSVGHETKMLSIAYLPALLGAVWMIYQGRYWLGAGLTALFSSILIFHNHYQIVYYFLLLAAAMTIGHFIQWIRQKDFRTLATASAFGAETSVSAGGKLSDAFSARKSVRLIPSALAKRQSTAMVGFDRFRSTSDNIDFETPERRERSSSDRS